jgi:hypothetical protein
VLVDRDVLALQQFPDGSRHGADLPMFAVDGQGDVLVEAGVSKCAAGNCKRGGASDGSRNDLAQNSPKWPDRYISGRSVRR